MLGHEDTARRQLLKAIGLDSRGKLAERLLKQLNGSDAAPVPKPENVDDFTYEGDAPSHSADPGRVQEDHNHDHKDDGQG